MGKVKGCLHIYCGDGKGKTTASVGLAVRAAGSGMKVLFCQYMKDGSSSEIAMLQKLGVETQVCTQQFGFYWNMDEEKKAAAEDAYKELFRKVVRKVAGGGYGLLVIDEFMSAYHYGWIDQKEAVEFLMDRPEGLEVVLTGREPGEELLELADYVTEMRKVKHPFDRGIPARKGIEL